MATQSDDNLPVSDASSSLIGRHLEIDHHHSAFTSTFSSATDWRYENGRRYHSYDDGTYHLPNDEEELDRLDLQHEMWRMTLKGALYWSPIPETTQSVLDIGCGTGCWAIEFAETHPNATVVGTDLSPVQPDFVPPNCSFLVDNAEKDWAFSSKFDFIHARMLCMGMHDWPHFLHQCWTNLQPGGWLELREIAFPWGSVEDTPIEESPLLKWSDMVREGAARAGIDTVACLSFEDKLRDLGFIKIKKEHVQWPLTPWPKGSLEKKLGAYAQENLRSGLQGISMAVFCRHLGMTRDEVELNLYEARKDMNDPSKHYYAPM
ncbi:S-adenosyl-L-methionine-dependent methyltransferase [Saccharata proteae CBS 121410]|uniref:S-adenosyl-L-methionine-dependent methyltransferase n=1 Tax=Saccharata proteae CBS 121410 TaxID=1314787 RepID=A0A9P4LYE0_9PEZI|nr:S-adenosyl-L-methionine-dependent methyltransferase [Saccharata proteae CBS 121410]